MNDVQKASIGLGEQAKMRHIMLGNDKGEAWMRQRRANLQRKKARYLSNRAARAAFYSENDGQISAGNVSLWHSTLNALSAGTYG